MTFPPGPQFIEGRSLCGSILLAPTAGIERRAMGQGDVQDALGNTCAVNAKIDATVDRHRSIRVTRLLRSLGEHSEDVTYNLFVNTAGSLGDQSLCGNQLITSSINTVQMTA